jgi:hypothetical protein
MQVDAFEKRMILIASQLSAARNKRVKLFDWSEKRSTRQETLLPNLSSSRQVFYSTEGGGVGTKASLKRTME